MAELTARYDEMQTSLDTLRTQVDALSATKKSDDKQRALAAVDERIERTKRDMKMIEMEVRQVNADSRAGWRAKLKDENNKLKQICRDVEWARSDGVNPAADMALDVSKEEDLADYGRGLQNETDIAADNALANIAEAKEVHLNVQYR